MPSAPSAAGLRAAGPLLLFAGTIFLSAWLLFQVQPMFAKMALPLLGGTPVVWNTALVFFQGALLLGYLYAHALNRHLPLRAQIVVHVALLGFALLALPVAIGESWRDPGEGTPILWLVGLLTVSVGLPFFALSANAPMLQSWFATTGHKTARDPYFLYAASNFGSMLALLAYPFFIEPGFALKQQSGLWTSGYAVLAALIAACGLAVWRGRGKAAADDANSADDAPIRWVDRARWLALAFVPAGLLVSTTTLLTTDIAAIPLLWIAPLALYLLSFVLVFARKPIMAGAGMRRVQTVLLCLAAFAATIGEFGSTYVSLGLVLATLLATAQVCHGELARRRPPARRLTEFYVWMSLGGILGSAFCALLAPLLFDRVIEFAILLVLAALLRGFSLPQLPIVLPRPAFAVVTLRAAGAPIALGAAAAIPVLSGASFDVSLGAFLIVAAAVLGIALISGHHPVRLAVSLVVLSALDASFGTASGTTSRIHSERTYFATHQILSLDRGRYMALVHGSTIHGVQAVDPARRRDVLGYFHADSGIGRVFRALENEKRLPREVAVIGMGAGTLACYQKPDQRWSFFEIDPAVIRIAKDPRWFHFLADCAPNARLAVGDGRLLIAAEPAGRYDLLVADAFSSDSIPVHLYTREAISLYFQKLAPSGVLLLNVSNRYIDVEPALAALVREAGLAGRIFRSSRPAGVEASMRFPSIWIAMARDEATLAPLTDAFDGAQPSAWGRWRPLAERKGVRAWTDDYSNLIDVIR